MCSGGHKAVTVAMETAEMLTAFVMQVDVVNATVCWLSLTVCLAALH